MDCSTPGSPVLHHFPELAQTHVHRVSDVIQPSCPLSSPSSPVFYLSQHQGLVSESALHSRWPKYWCFSFSISRSNEYSGLISFRVDWLNLPALQGILKSSPASLFKSIISSSLSLLYPYMTPGKTIALIIWTFVHNVISLIFNKLSGFVISFFPRESIF